MYLIDRIERKRHSAVRSSHSSVLASQKELKAGSAGAVGDANGASKLNEVADGDLRVCLDERGLRIDDIVNAAIRMECGLDVGEDDHGAVCTAARMIVNGETSVLNPDDIPNSGVVLREADRVVESETERLVHLFSALATVEEVLIKVVANREEGTTCCISCSIYTVWTGHTPGKGTYVSEDINVSWNVC